jgi:hypothetical protein
MIVNINDRREVERFLHFASIHELSAEREHMNRLMAANCPSKSADHLKALAGRINYELRFRKPA